MKKERKNEVIEDLKKKISSSKAAVVSHYRGLNSEQIYNLRRQLKSSSAEVKVAKNTLLKLASKGTSYEKLSDHYVGPVAITFIHGDVAAAAKVLTKCYKDMKEFEFKVGLLQDKLLNFNELESLSKLPSREILLSQLLSVMSGPMRGFATALAGVPRGFVTALSALKDKKAAQSA